MDAGVIVGNCGIGGVWVWEMVAFGRVYLMRRWRVPRFTVVSNILGHGCNGTCYNGMGNYHAKQIDKLLTIHMLTARRGSGEANEHE